MTKILLFACLCAAFYTPELWGQSWNLCASDPSDWTDVPSATQHRSEGVDTFDVVFHLVHLGQPEGIGSNISDEQVKSALLSLNRDFGAWPIHDSISIAPNGVNTELFFRLACVDPNGNPTTGIKRVNGAVVPGYATDGFNFKTNGGGNYQALSDLSHWPQNRYINIWVTHRIETFMGTLTGGGGFGGGNAVFQQGYGGVYMVFRYVGCDVDGSQGFDLFNPYGRLISHEMGHYLGLLHTFQGESCLETNCATQGDRVCDTEPHTNSVANDTTCNEWIECGTREPVENLMNYSGIICGNIFTEGQKQRMKTTVNNFYTEMINLPACPNVAIQHIEGENLIAIYPNPVQDAVIIQNPKQLDYDYQLYDAYMRQVLSGRVVRQTQTMLKTEFLPHGNYFLSIRNQQGIVIKTQKLWIH
ncbi:MAG: zinc-dependent metalloprotease [Saprospiraceae bacterium]|nr:zinc-dependent metalloprotease [Saprospiraceae bacterium]